MAVAEQNKFADFGAPGRFVLPHRNGARVEVGEPIQVGGPRPWLCTVKLMAPCVGQSEADAAQTLLLRMGRGMTPSDARRDAMAQLTLVYGSPIEPPPPPRIMHKPEFSDFGLFRKLVSLFRH